MIRLEVEDYCHKCSDFLPEVKNPEIMYMDNIVWIMSDTIVTCENRKICQNIYDHIESRFKNECKE